MHPTSSVQRNRPLKSIFRHGFDFLRELLLNIREKWLEFLRLLLRCSLNHQARIVIVTNQHGQLRVQGQTQVFNRTEIFNGDRLEFHKKR